MLQHLIRTFHASYHTAKVDKGGLLEPFFVVTSVSFQNAGDLIALIVLSCCFTAVALQGCHSCKEKTTATRRCRAAYNFTALNLLRIAAADASV